MSSETESGKQCKAETKKGTQCEGQAVTGFSYCKIHIPDDSTEKLQSEYNALQPIAKRFAVSLQHQIECLIDSGDLTLGVPVERRVKAWESISEKMERKGGKYKQITDLDDLVGLRLIFLFNRDIEGIDELLSQKFQIHHFENTASRLEETQFGYQSVHYIISYPDEWCSVPTMQEFKGLKAELQVRTLAQHIWAAASHKLQYKQENNVPAPLRRSIHRVSALLETVDLEFERLLEQRETYVVKIPGDIEDDLGLNVDLLRSVLEDSWPKENISNDEDYAELLDELLYLEINTVENLRIVISNNYGAALVDEKSDLEKYTLRSKTRDEFNTEFIERLEKGVFYTLCGLTRVAVFHTYGSVWRDSYFIGREESST